MISINDYDIKPTIFPDNTSQVWKLPEELFEAKKFNIQWEYENETELFHLVQLVDLLKHGNVPRPINLYMPYLPYARQDKGIDNNSTFALTSFAKIINSLNFTSVQSVDAHSVVASHLIDNFQSFYPHHFKDCYSSVEADSIAYPDQGARDRYAEGYPKDTIIGHKTRDQSTGYITGYNFEGDPKDKIILIVDDLCDGGMTFKILAEQLYKAGARQVHLAVSHGIFSKGLLPLRESGIMRVFTRKGEVDKFPMPSNRLLETETSNM